MYNCKFLRQTYHFIMDAAMISGGGGFANAIKSNFLCTRFQSFP
jgi:hypothetical protein